MINRCRKLNASMTIAVAVGCTQIFAFTTAQALSFWVSPVAEWDSATRRDAAVAAITNVCNRYNIYGNFNNGNDGVIEVTYNAGVPTAQANFGGTITFGGTWPNDRVTQHESNHWLGSGTYWNWGNLFDGWGGWTGPQVSKLIQQFEGDGARIYRSGVHFYFYGLNYDSEVTSDAVYMRNIALMYAMRQDMGSEPIPWSATNVTLAASDPAGFSAFNWFGGGWSNANYQGWSDKYFPHTGAAYATGTFAIRTPQGYPSWTFGGDSLTVNTGGQLLYNGWGTGGVVTINQLSLAGGTIKHDQNPQDLFQLDGTMTLAAAGGTVNAANGNIKIIAPIGGVGSLTKNGNYTTTLSNINTFTGGTVVNAGTLTLANGGTAGVIRGTLTINSGALVKLSASDALGWGSNATAVTQINLNGGTLDEAFNASKGYLASLTLTGGTMSSSGGAAFHINASAGKTISSLASATTSVISANIAIRGANSTLSLDVADGAAATDLSISGVISNSPLEAGANGIQKTGAGTLVLAGGNTYTGATTVTGGMLAYTTSPSNIGSVTTSNNAGLRVQALEASPALISTSLTLGMGSSLTFDLNGLSTISPPISTGAFTASGVVTVNLLNGGALAAGTYKLVGYTSFDGGGTFSGVSFPIGPRSTGTLSNNGSNGLYLTVTGGDKALWTGLDSGAWQTTSTGTNKNWKLQTSGTSIDYLEGDNVLFNDSATESTSVNIAANISPVKTTFINSTKNYTVSGAAGIAGSGGLTKSGTGSLTLLNANAFTGNVSVNGGTLYANVGNAPNNRAFSYVSGITVGNGATVRSSANALFGWDGLQDKPITVNAGGTLTANGGLLSDVGVGKVTLNGGTLATLSSGATDYGSWRFDNTGDILLVTDNSTVSATNVKFGDVNATIDVASGKTLNFTGTVTNTTNGGISYLAKAGFGTMVLSGANTYSGGTTTTGGTISISADNNLGAASSPASFNAATLKTTSTSPLGISHVVTFSGSGNVFNIAGNGVGTTGQGARVYFSNTNTILGNGALSVIGNGTLNGAAPNTKTAGVGALVIGASNTYSGNVTLQNGGLIEYASANALGRATVILGNEGEFTVANGTNAGNAIVVSGGTNSVLSFTNAIGTSSGPITLNADLAVGLRNWYDYGSVTGGTVSGVISGSGGLTVNSGSGTGGTLTLTGANSFTGGVIVSGATLYANPGNAATNRAFSYVSGIIVNNGGTLRSGTNGLFGWNGTQEHPITVNAGGTLLADGGDTGDVGVGSVTLSGGLLATTSASIVWGSWRFDDATDKLLVTADSIASATNVKFGSASAAIEVASGKTLNFTGTVTDATSGGISYLKKTGAGTLILAGTNTYSGATSINAGTVNLSGSLAVGSAVTVANGATLSGSGTINGSLALATGSVHAPGNSAGNQTVVGTLRYANGSHVRWTLPTNSNATGAASRIAAGNVTITAGAVIDLVLNAAGSTVNFTDPFWTQSRTWNVMTCSNKSGNLALGTVSADAAGRPVSNYGTLSLQQSATSVSLVFTPYTPTELWRQANFGVNWNNSSISADAADPDHDGLSNLLEYALGSNPNTSDASSVPQVSTSTGKLKINFTRNTEATDVTASVMAADDMTSSWSEIARSVNGSAFVAIAPGASVNESGSGSIKSVQATDIYLITDPVHPKRFMRLEVKR